MRRETTHGRWLALLAIVALLLATSAPVLADEDDDADPPPAGFAWVADLVDLLASWLPDTDDGMEASWLPDTDDGAGGEDELT